MNNDVLILWSSVIVKEKSFSYELLNQFLNYYKSKNSNSKITFLDLNKEKVSNKVLNNQNFVSFFKDSDCDKYINQLKSFKKVVVATSMTNFHIPATLKNYLDHILVANKTFSYKYNKKGDAIGLLKNLDVVILTTQGAPLGWYPWGNISEFLKSTFEFIGAKVVNSLTIGGTKIPENKDLSPSQLVKKYDDKIKKIADSF